MAGLDEELMEAYFNDEVTYKWFYDGRLWFVTKNNSYKIENSTVGHYIGVKVVYGDKSVSSDEFKIEEATSSGLLGDATEDSIVYIVDATTIQKSIVGMTKLTENGKKLSDVDGNGIINVVDATAIQKHIVGMNTGFAIGQPV